MESAERAGIAYGVCAATIWGAWPVVSKLGVHEALTPYDITALRFGVAGLLLLPVVLRRGVMGVGWGGALLLACGAGVPYTLVTVGGLALAPAGHAGVIAPSCSLLFSFLGGWLMLGDRPGAVRLTGVGVVVMGVVVTGWAGLTSGGDATEWVGDVMFAAGGFLWATYTVAARRWRIDPLHAAALVSVVSMVLYVPAYLAVCGLPAAGAPSTGVAAQAIFQGGFAAVLALVLHTKAVAVLGTARGTLFPALVPGVAALLAYPTLGETPSGVELAGIGIVMAGMLGAFAAPGGFTRMSRMKTVESTR